MKKQLAFSILLVSIISTNLWGHGLKSFKSLTSEIEDPILINQIGFYPKAQKVALIRINTNKFEIIDTKTNKVVFTGTPGKLKYWELSGDSVSTADFTSLVKPGKYKLCLNNQSICSSEFEIGQNLYTSIAKASIKGLYLNRTAIDIKEEFGGKWARPAGHADTKVLIHSSAATIDRPEGSIISSPGGWYDAGDYNKYIVNSSITTYTLLLFHDLYTDYSNTLNINIPESKNAVSDVIDELLFNLKWMLTMQDPADGGVYHKLTCKKFGPMEMPDKDTDTRYVVAKSTSAALDFSATMAMASRVFSKNQSGEIRELGKTCLEAAKKAYNWAKSNPNIYFKNPSDISTGEYGDDKLTDEFFWASTEMALATKDMSLIAEKDIKNQLEKIQSWDQVGFLGIISLSTSKMPLAAKNSKIAQAVLLKYANLLVDKANTSPYRISLDFFKWGSSSDVANQAIIKLVAHIVTGNSKYLNSIQSDVDYILGRNATGYSFVTGYGTKQAMDIHHRPSAADGVADPYPGLLIGGPNTVTFADCPGITRSKFPAKSFVDKLCSYSTNEIAINWNAPLFFLMGALDANKK